MTPLMKWTDDFLLHIDELDDQHRNLFLIINRLIVHQRTGGPREELLDLLHVLVAYAQTHFRSEELHMTDTQYPHADAHSKEHHEFAKNIQGFIKDYKSHEEGLSYKMLTFLRHWWVNHVGGSDQKFGNHLRKEGYLP